MSELEQVIEDMGITVDFTGGEFKRVDNWDHREWTGTLHYNDQEFTTKYRTGMAHEGPTEVDFIYSVVSDAYSYRNNPSLLPFAQEFGYDDDVAKALEVFEGCKEINEGLANVFNDEEFDRLAYAQH